MRLASNFSGTKVESRSCLVMHNGFLVIALLAALACAGPPGKDAPGSADAGGDGGTNPAGVIDYGVMTPAEIEAANMTAVLTGLTIPADGRPVANLKVTERHGSGVKGLSATAASWRFAMIKLTQGVNGSANDSWVSYMAANDHSTASTENAAGTALTDNGDGTYVYQFAKAINAGVAAAGTVYEPSKVHRFILLLSASGNPFSPINLVKDFVPATDADVTGQNEKVDQAACLECHTQFRAIAGETGEFGAGQFHGGVRFDVRTCAACHNDQKRFAATGTAIDSPSVAANGTWTGNMIVLNNEAFVNFPVFIHKIHMGEDLKMTGGTYTGFAKPYEVTYPQDVRNCVKCHRSPAPLADNWKSQPSRRACNACHDNISFVSPAPNGRTLHTGGAVADDNCLICHAVGGTAKDIPSAHLTVSDPNPHNIYVDQTATGTSNTNAAFVAAAGAVPPGAKVITYEVSSVSLAGSNPQIVFRLMMADPTANPPVAAAPVIFQTFGGSVTELIPNLVGSPSAYFVYAVPQDNITAPADFNVSASGYIRNIWNGSATGAGAGTLSAPDASGYYTLKLTGVTIPSSAKMLTGGIGYTYSLGSAPTFNNNTQPLTQINLPAYPYTPNASGFSGKGGLIVPAPDVWKVATGFTARRTVVANAKCAGCHVALGVGPDFHAGQRNDAPSCNFCHRPNQTSSGWSANQKDFIHGIHGAEKRTVRFNWHAPSATKGYYQVTYPAVLNRCEMCHLPGTYDFSLASTTSALPNMLYSTVGQGRYNSNPATNPTGYFSIAPSTYVTSNNTVDYGYGFSTSNVSATLPDGISGTQGATSCTPAAPCICSATNPCSVDVSGPYTVNNVAVTFTQKIGTVTTTCDSSTTCTCTTAQPCTGVVATCTLAAPCNAQPTTLVNSPIAAACSACHDSSAAIDHMQTNGASIWERRDIAFSKPQKEECLICHGPNRVAAISLVHLDRTP
jgi:OmcA/MtrC family decaheme c-type cytochrome